MFDVIPKGWTYVAAAEDGDLVARCQQLLYRAATEKACPTDDEYVHQASGAFAGEVLCHSIHAVSSRCVSSKRERTCGGKT